MSEQTQTPASPDRYEWLLEEYKLLSQHYFHEDSEMLKTVGLYATLNGALLAFVTSKFADTDRPIIGIVPAAGMAICIAWFATQVRNREWREYIEGRIKEIEERMHRIWGSQEPVPLDIRTVRRWDDWSPAPHWYNWLYRKSRDWPASLTVMIMPIVMGEIWLLLFVWYVVTLPL